MFTVLGIGTCTGVAGSLMGRYSSSSLSGCLRHMCVRLLKLFSRLRPRTGEEEKLLVRLSERLEAMLVERAVSLMLSFTRNSGTRGTRRPVGGYILFAVGLKGSSASKSVLRSYLRHSTAFFSSCSELSVSRWRSARVGDWNWVCNPGMGSGSPGDLPRVLREPAWEPPGLTGRWCDSRAACRNCGRPLTLSTGGGAGAAKRLL
jgi:hypothetical protein